MSTISRLYAKGRGFAAHVFRGKSRPVVLRKRGNAKNVLYSYLAYALPKRGVQTSFDGHSNRWESREIAYQFLKKGYDITAINWDDVTFTPTRDFHVFFDVHANLGRLAGALPRARKLLHITGSFPGYSNARELERIRALERRRNCLYSPKRRSDEETFNLSLEVADSCSLIGTERTLSTFPEKHQRKIRLVSVSASTLLRQKRPEEFVPTEREFLWFFGLGAVHKGLDLLLEIFARRPDIRLNVVGEVASEKDFVDIYKKELFETPNITFWGYIKPTSERFLEIVKRCFCFLAPTCSEGISPAAVTCMQAGLLPIASLDSGVVDENGPGIVLTECSLDEIESAADSAFRMPSARLVDEIQRCQELANMRYSRDRFATEMSAYLDAVL